MNTIAAKTIQGISADRSTDRGSHLKKQVITSRADLYEVFVYELASRITDSPEEAEAAVKEMMNDIRRSAAGPHLSFKERLVERMALLRILRL